MSASNTNLEELANQIQSLRRAIKVACGIFVLAPIYLLYWLATAVPKFEKILNDMLGGSELPGLTKFVIGVSGFVGGNFLYLLLLLVPAYLAYLKFMQKSQRAWYIYVALASLITTPILQTVMSVGLQLGMTEIYSIMNHQSLPF